jgi:hypothetical protein
MLQAPGVDGARPDAARRASIPTPPLLALPRPDPSRTLNLPRHPTPFPYPPVPPAPQPASRYDLDPGGTTFGKRTEAQKYKDARLAKSAYVPATVTPASNPCLITWGKGQIWGKSPKVLAAEATVKAEKERRRKLRRQKVRLVPIRPRSRGERHSLRTLPARLIVSLRPRVPSFQRAFDRRDVSLTDARVPLNAPRLPLNELN